MDPDDLLQEYLLRTFPNPERKGCPAENVLKALAERQLALTDPALLHMSSCSECYAEYLNYRRDWKEHGGASVFLKEHALRGGGPVPVPAPSLPAAVNARSPLRVWAAAAALAVMFGGGLFYKGLHHGPSTAGVLVSPGSGSLIAANVDLFNAVTVRGGGDDAPALLEQVSLPSSVVHLSLTLPRFSQSGAYEILVARDRAGKDIVTRGLGNAVEADGKVSLVVTLDLRKAAAGSYFLATVRGSDNGTYYYPLRVN